MIFSLYALWVENWKLNYAVYAVLLYMSPVFFFILLPLTRWKTIIIVSVMFGPESALYICGLPHICNSGKTYDETNTLGLFQTSLKINGSISFVYSLDNGKKILKRLILQIGEG